MRTIETIAELRSAVGLAKRQQKQIGFVPTMGALHEGHLSLVRLSKQQTDLTVVSIFVNPTQFGPNEDFSRYPRTLEADSSLLVGADVDLLFLPDASEIYPNGFSTSIGIGELSQVFEGAIRPGHFDGVATIVGSLFNIVQPDLAFFGQKDAQQVAVIRKLVRDLHYPVKLVIGPTLREPDGLALSSRNRYLSPPNRKEATALWKALMEVLESLLPGTTVRDAICRGTSVFEQFAPDAKLEYLALVDSETFHPIDSFETSDWQGADDRSSDNPPTLIIAARLGETRLIDNVRIE
ncbi:MAG: pantoate--beta-alanine ligase [Bacteroidota bacterium]|nr:pantoate--beta-alanine ligase [Bacteroidota bacterium]MDP4233829.1 pantoate--beta-alanine ligase [Bacteroidota bacterium]MDP4242472.1 pantoate--beta-alanine ligase [Bacteroidota bacterium]MDP4289060.1 pantoate--beta-alanine ligase [Bacteroidota bacterium]